MSKLFSPPPPPMIIPPAPPPAPTPMPDAGSALAQEAARRKFISENERGRSSTMLSEGKGGQTGGSADYTGVKLGGG